MNRTADIKIPAWFKNGIKFNSKWIGNGDNVCTLISFNPVTNLAEVEVNTKGSQFTEDGWDLQCTIWAFEKSEYTLIEEEK